MLAYLLTVRLKKGMLIRSPIKKKIDETQYLLDQNSLDLFQNGLVDFLD